MPAIERMIRTVDACTAKFGGEHLSTRGTMNTLVELRTAFDQSASPSADTP